MQFACELTALEYAAADRRHLAAEDDEQQYRECGGWDDGNAGADVRHSSIDDAVDCCADTHRVCTTRLAAVQPG